ARRAMRRCSIEWPQSNARAEGSAGLRAMWITVPRTSLPIQMDGPSKTTTKRGEARRHALPKHSASVPTEKAMSGVTATVAESRRLSARPRREHPLSRVAYLADLEYDFLRAQTSRTVKITMPSPSLLVMYWRER